MGSVSLRRCLSVGYFDGYIGKINAVDDGIPFVSFLGFLTFFLGQDFWHTEILGFCQLSDLLVALIYIGGAGTYI